MGVEFIFLTVVVLQQILHFWERKDLYSRIMARDLTDYKTNTVKVKDLKIKRPEVIQL